MTNHANILLDQNELDIILEFEKTLEQLFAVETKVIISPSDDDIVQLAIEIDSNFSLSEMISLFKMPFDFIFRKANLSKILLRFQTTVYNLNHSLVRTIDIEEISVYFKNTSITIHAIHRNSILEELEYIVHAVINHFEHYSTIIGHVPNEIHIPVLEDITTKELLNQNNPVKPVSFKSPYARYWGLYFDSIKRPLIYNLERTNIKPGDLDLYLD